MRLALLLVGAVVACRKDSAATVGPAPDALPGAQASGVSPTGLGSAVAPRCRGNVAGVMLGEGGLEDLDIGDGVAHGDGYAIGAVHHAQAGRVPAVLFVGRNVGDASVVDLGPTLGDAPPARVASCSSGLLAAAFRLTEHPAPTGAGPRTTRDLGVYSIDSLLVPHALLTIPQRRDDSLSSDLACSGNAALAVWDETVSAVPGVAARGVIRGANFLGQRNAEPRDLSPPDSDTESPRVLSSGAGFLVFWLARRVELANTLDSGSGEPPGRHSQIGGSTSSEAVGEARAYGWLEMVVLDAGGNATGPVRRLTSLSGHVSAYDVTAIADGAKNGIVAVVRDDAEPVDGAGGALLRVRAWDDSVEAPQALPIDGLGRGAPAFVDGASAPWLTWVGPHEGIRLLPLDTAGAVVGPPSAEDRLDEARLLLLLGADGRVLVAAPRDKRAQLQVFTCRR